MMSTWKFNCSSRNFGPMAVRSVVQVGPSVAGGGTKGLRVDTCGRKYEMKLDAFVTS